MDYDKSIQIAEERDYKVVKANEIIQRAKFDLHLLEQKTFCYAVSKVKPTDTKDTEYTFAINEYCDVCGINRNDGRTLQNVKESLQRLRNKSFYLIDPDGSHNLIGWLSKVRIQPKSGKIKIKFDEDMQNYLVGRYSNYAQYSLLCVLPMRSTYSIRLYELLKSYAGQGAKQKEFDIQDLKDRLAAPYVRFPDFRRKALDPATREINEYTDIEISWQPITKGRKVIKVRFEMRIRDTLGRFLSSTRASDMLDGQMELQQDGSLTEFRRKKGKNTKA